MPTFIKNAWEFSGSRSLSAWLLFGIAIVISIGSVIMRHHQPVFYSLGRVLLPEWIGTYGVENLSITWWLFLSLLLFFFLAVNTFVCTTNRVIGLLEKFTSLHKSTFFLKFSPHIMHIGFILLLVGHLISHTIGVNLTNNIIQKNGTISVCLSDLKVGLKDLKVEFEKGTLFKSLEGSPKNISASLSFIGPKCIKDKVISINRPVWFNGLSFHMDDFYPKSKFSKRTPYISLIIKKDPGIKLQLTGVALFAFGLFIYIFLLIQSQLDRVHNSGSVPANCDLNLATRTRNTSHEHAVGEEKQL